MPERLDGLSPVRDLVNEQMHPTTMHGTRDLVVIACPRQDPDSAVGDDHRSFMRKLGEKIINRLRHLCD